MSENNKPLPLVDIIDHEEDIKEVLTPEMAEELSDNKGEESNE